MVGKGRWAPLVALVVVAPLAMPFGACFGLGAGMLHALLLRAALRMIRGCRPASLGGASLMTSFSFLLLVLMGFAAAELLGVSWTAAVLVVSYVHAFFLSPYSFATFHVVDPDSRRSLEDSLCNWDALNPAERRVLWLLRGSAAVLGMLVWEASTYLLPGYGWLAFLLASWCYASVLAAHGVRLARVYERVREGAEPVHIPRRFVTPMMLALVFGVGWGMLVLGGLARPTLMEAGPLPADVQVLAFGERLPGTDVRVEAAGAYAVSVEAADGGGVGEVRRAHAMSAPQELYFERRGAAYVLHTGRPYAHFIIDGQGVRMDDSHAQRFRAHIGVFSLALMLAAFVALTGALWLLAPATQHLRRLSRLGRLGEDGPRALVEAVLHVEGAEPGQRIPGVELAGARIEAVHEEWRWQIPEGGVELGTRHLPRAGETVTLVGTFGSVEKGVREAFAPWPEDALLVAGSLNATVADGYRRILRPSRTLTLASVALALAGLIVAVLG